MEEAERARDVAQAETIELAQKGFKSAVWGWHKNREETLAEMLRYKARDKLREEALKRHGIHSSNCGAFNDSHPTNQFPAMDKRCTCGLRAAIDITPEEAREKEAKR